MATTQSEIDGPFTPSMDESTDSESDDIEDYSGEVDIFGCPVTGCEYTGPSVHCLYSHMNQVHHGNGGMEGLKQQKLVEFFNLVDKDKREYRPNKLNMPF